MATPNPTDFSIDHGSHQNCDCMGPIPYLQTQPSTYHHKDGGSYLTVDHTRRPGVCRCKKYSAVNNAKHIFKPSLLRIYVAYKHPNNTRAHSAPFCSQNGWVSCKGHVWTNVCILCIYIYICLKLIHTAGMLFLSFFSNGVKNLTAPYTRGSNSWDFVTDDHHPRIRHAMVTTSSKWRGKPSTKPLDIWSTIPISNPVKYGHVILVTT